jgi:hypothetical protein
METHVKPIGVASVSSVQLTTPTITPGRPGADGTPLYSEQLHDHREYTADPVLSSKYSAGGSADVASFSSSPGLARPGMMSPGVP